MRAKAFARPPGQGKMNTFSFIVYNIHGWEWFHQKYVCTCICLDDCVCTVIYRGLHSSYCMQLATCGIRSLDVDSFPGLAHLLCLQYEIRTCANGMFWVWITETTLATPQQSWLDLVLHGQNAIVHVQLTVYQPYWAGGKLKLRLCILFSILTSKLSSPHCPTPRNTPYSSHHLNSVQRTIPHSHTNIPSLCIHPSDGMTFLSMWLPSTLWLFCNINWSMLSCSY